MFVFIFLKNMLIIKNQRHTTPPTSRTNQSMLRNFRYEIFRMSEFKIESKEIVYKQLRKLKKKSEISIRRTIE